MVDVLKLFKYEKKYLKSYKPIIKVNAIDENLFKHLMTPLSLIELLIRTSGEQRISNF